MTIQELLVIEREIWGEKRFSLPEILVRTGVTYGDLCRIARGEKKDTDLTQDDLMKELGNLLASTVRFCDDLGLDPEACINRALTCHRAFVK